MTSDEFLMFVRDHVAEHPECGAQVAAYAQAGVDAALAGANERAADMEVALVAATTKRLKGAEQLIVDKLRKWEGQTSLRWDWLTNQQAARRG